MRIEVNLGDRRSLIDVAHGKVATVAEGILEIGRPSSIALISHPALDKRYGGQVASPLSQAGIPVHKVRVAPGERSKSIQTFGRIHRELAALRCDRKSVIVALGGGVIGDLAGFVAATYLRGVRLVQIPTTLLAQVDASVGGKTAVDLPEGKNLVGAFYQPERVIVDPSTLASLPMRELRSGLAEVIKYGMILDADFHRFNLNHLSNYLRRDADALIHCITRSCQIKAEVVQEDETEQGLRAVLNFGHTVGHAIEAVTGYRLLKHGEAVAIGMAVECRVGELIGITPSPVTETLCEGLTKAGLPQRIPPGLSTGALLAAMQSDKKTTHGVFRCILPSEVGKVTLVDTPLDVLRAAISEQSSSE